jgi:hypothetical protein
MNQRRLPKNRARLDAGNVSRVRFVSGNPPEIQFCPDPKGSRSLWFYFQAKGPDEESPADPSGKLSLVLEHYETLAGAKDPSECAPLYRVGGQWWARMSPGKPEQTADGRMNATWVINQPEEDFEVALCYPYEDSDLKKLVDKKDGVWMRDMIGLSPGGRPISRLANAHEKSTRFPNGLFVVARERGCDMPAAWLLDGLLQRLASAKKNPFLTWAIPIADPDAARSGAWRSEPDLGTAWREDSPRQEVHVIAADLARWKARCQPSLALSICAAELSETGGIYCTLPDGDKHKEQHQLAQKWANVVLQKLGKDFASPEFVRSAKDAGSSFPDWLAGTSGLCGLTLHVPWVSAGDTIFSPKKFRDAGRLIADALVEKRT